MDAPYTTEQKEDVRKMLARMLHVFTRNGKDLGCTNEVRHEIKLTDKLPFRLPHRRVPPARLEEFRTAVEDLLKQGSSWNQRARMHPLWCWCAKRMTV